MKATFTRWALFGVLLPLLPIASRILTGWIDGNAIPTFVDLFENGDLLVLAIVVSAAGIGDLVFDVNQTKAEWSLRQAVTVSLALITIIIAVLIYGLLSLRQDSIRSDISYSDTKLRGSQMNDQSAAKDLVNEAGTESMSAHRLHLAVESRNINDIVRAEAELRTNDVNLTKAAGEVTNYRDVALLGNQLSWQKEQLARISSATALISVILFSLSLFIGAMCIFASEPRKPQKIKKSLAAAATS
ncbi:hypothetical protein ACIA5C_19880 [Actinoplanes sp. NPDC051343]|uniref:hypothetical protein n=1 Tax=Actinoplanes sp. NPDC051343 TaxID=3363906 RepID=UPI00379D98F1